jgi:cell division protein ZapE
MNQTDALRLVAFIDRVYDAQIPLLASGVPISTVFGGDMINGGYRKKYLRCMSRLIALTNMV